MIPKLTYKLNGLQKEHVFDPAKHNTFHQEWEADEVLYKNPFTREKKWKRWGYYYGATITYEGIEYLLVDLDLKDFFNANVTDRKFYPNIDNPNEYYDVDVNEGIAMDDAHVAEAYLNVDIIFRGTHCYETPLNHPVGYAGDRSHTIAQLANYTIAELSGGI